MTKQHLIRSAAMVRGILEGDWSTALPDWAPNGRGDSADVEMSTEQHGNVSPNYIRAVWTAEAFIILFREYNPRFNEEKFLQACGLVEQSVKRSRKVRSNEDSPAPLSPDGRYMS